MYKHDFSALRRDGKIYVDKTPLAEDHGELFIYLTSEGLSPHARCIDVLWPQE